MEIIVHNTMLKKQIIRENLLYVYINAEYMRKFAVINHYKDTEKNAISKVNFLKIADQNFTIYGAEFYCRTGMINGLYERRGPHHSHAKQTFCYCSLSVPPISLIISISEN